MESLDHLDNRATVRFGGRRVVYLFSLGEFVPLCEFRPDRMYGTASRLLFGKQFGDSLPEDFVDAGVFPVQFSGPPVADVTFFVDQVCAGPHGIAPCLP